MFWLCVVFLGYNVFFCYLAFITAKTRVVICRTNSVSSLLKICQMHETGLASVSTHGTNISRATSWHSGFDWI